MKIKNIKLVNQIMDMYYQKFKIYVFYKYSIMSTNKKFYSKADLEQLPWLEILNLKKEY